MKVEWQPALRKDHPILAYHVYELQLPLQVKLKKGQRQQYVPYTMRLPYRLEDLQRRQKNGRDIPSFITL